MSRIARLILALLVSAAAAVPAAASIVDPSATTLARLAGEADAVVHARVVAGPGGARTLELQVVDVLWTREGAPPPSRATASACDVDGAGGVGLAFLGRGPDGRAILLGGARGFVAADPEAEVFVRRVHAAKQVDGGEGLRLFVPALASRSARVRDDALRGLAGAPAELAQLESSLRDVARAAAEGALASPASDPAPAVALLAGLPGAAGDPALLAAARRGVAPHLLGPVLRGRPAAIDALLADLGADAAVDARVTALRVLGYAGSGRAVPALKPLLRGATAGPDLAWAAVALAYAGGDEALGALEFALHNHPDPEARRFIDALLADPAGTRAALARTPAASK